jgi:hypothetical protein
MPQLTDCAKVAFLNKYKAKKLVFVPSIAIKVGTLLAIQLFTNYGSTTQKVDMFSASHMVI